MKLTNDLIKEMSSIKKEPEWMLSFREKALYTFNQLSDPDFGPKLNIDYDNINYYKKSDENLTNDWNNISDKVRNEFNELGVIDAERKYLDGIGAPFKAVNLFSLYLTNLLKYFLNKSGCFFNAVSVSKKITFFFSSSLIIL